MYLNIIKSLLKKHVADSKASLGVCNKAPNT